MAIRPIIQIMLSSRHFIKTRGIKLIQIRDIQLRECDVTRLRWLRGHTGHYPANGSLSLLSRLLTLSTLFTPHSAHIVTIPHFQTRSGLFILRVWIIRVPSHMLSSSPATNGYWVVSHWITTQYILLTSDIRSLTLHCQQLSSSDSLSYSYMKMFVSCKVLMLNTLCSVTTTPDYNLFSCIFLFTSSPLARGGPAEMWGIISISVPDQKWQAVAKIQHLFAT